MTISKRIILSLLLFFILVCLLYIFHNRSQELYINEPNLYQEKTISEQNIIPSNKNTDKQDLLNMISRLKKYTDIPREKISIPIYFINMDKNGDRREFMEQQLDKYATNYKRIKGFNGYQIKNKRADKVLYDGNVWYSFLNYYPELKISEIGCLMSHLIAIKTAYENGDEIAMILEDDTVVNLINFLDFSFDKIYQDAPSDWETINLFHMSDWNSEFLPSFYNSTTEYKYLLHDNRTYLYSAIGYIINRKGMKKIMDFAYDGDNNFVLGRNMTIAPNGPADFFIYDVTRSYYLTPDLFYPNNLSLQSTIHEEHTAAHITRSLDVVRYYDNKIKQKEFSKHYDIPVLYINLEKRKDRRQKMEKTLSIFPTVIRIEADYVQDNGALGCLQSHIKMLKYAIEHYPGKDVLFCEDDIDFVGQKGYEPRTFLFNFFEKKMKWDTLLLANHTQQSVPTVYKDLDRTFDSQTCSCYLVRAGYIQNLLNVFENSIAVYNRFGIWNNLTNASDQCWKVLQKVDMWLVPDKTVAKQYQDYSDIQKTIVNY